MVRRLMKWAFRIVLSSGLLCGLYILFLLHDVPHLDSIVSYRPMLTSQVLDQKGSVLGEFFHENRDFIPFNKIPTLIVKAFIASEDQKFYDHIGLDFQGIMRAFVANLKSGKIVQGGSTITQQVAKSLLLSPERTLTRKIREAYLAFKIENKLTKDEIITLYLNQIYLGHGAYGIQRAAYNYFRKTAEELTLSEIALLAGMPQAPSRYSPLKSPSSAKHRQKYVLGQLATSHVISDTQAQEAALEPIDIFPAPSNYDSKSAHFVEYIRRTLSEKMTEADLHEGGLRIQTSLNGSFQNKAYDAIWTGLRHIDKRRGYRGPLRKIAIEKKEETLADLKEKNFLSHPVSYSFLSDGTTESNYENPTGTLQKETIYECVVLDTTPTYAWISNGITEGMLHLKDMNWARPVNPHKHTSLERVRDITSVLHPGDVIQAKLTHFNPIEFSLEQDPIIEAALLSIHIPTGKILAMVGGKDFGQSQFNRTYQAMRQLGSTFKPLIYTKAIELGLAPNTLILDAPIVYEEKREPKEEDKEILAEAKAMDKAAVQQKDLMTQLEDPTSTESETTPEEENIFVWKPDNYGQVFMGDTTLREALIKSRNIPTIKLVQGIGVKPVIEFATLLGLNADFPKDLSLSLGSIATSLWEIMKAYAIFANGGKRVTYSGIEAITAVNTGSTSQKVEAPFEFKSSEEAEQVISPQLAFMITYLLKDAVQHGTGVSLNRLGKPFSGKTGTTNDFIDAWFIGYSPDVLTGVWVGFDQPEFMGVSEAGSKAAGPIWLSYMKEVVKTYPIQDFMAPEKIVFSWMDPKNGKIGAYKPGRIQVPFLEGAIPQNPLVIGGFGRISPQKIAESLIQNEEATPDIALTDDSEASQPHTQNPPPEEEELTDEEILFGQY
jgi:penicillin-binding protein 1A